MFASDYVLESHLKFPIFMLRPVEGSRERCASNNLSRDNKNFLLVAGVYTLISSFLEGSLQNSVPLSHFSTHLYQIISRF